MVACRETLLAGEYIVHIPGPPGLQSTIVMQRKSRRSGTAPLHHQENADNLVRGTVNVRMTPRKKATASRKVALDFQRPKSVFECSTTQFHMQPMTKEGKWSSCLCGKVGFSRTHVVFCFLYVQHCALILNASTHAAECLRGMGIRREEEVQKKAHRGILPTKTRL